LDIADAWLVEDAMQEYNDVAVDETISLYVVLGDEPTLVSEGQ